MTQEQQAKRVWAMAQIAKARKAGNNNAVIVMPVFTEDEDGNWVPSKETAIDGKNPEWCSVQVVSSKRIVSNNNFLYESFRSTLLIVKKANNAYRPGEILSGKLFVVESTIPTNINDLTQDLKYINSDAQANNLQCTVKGEPIYMRVLYTENINEQDQLLQHDNDDQIRGTLAEFKKRAKQRFLFFDTETTGLPKDWNAPITLSEKWPRLVQIAWLIYDGDGNRISGREYIIKPEGFSIPDESTRIHGISTSIALSRGIDLTAVLNDFSKEIQNADYLVAHNLSFDERIVGAEFLRKGFNNHLEGKRKICTMISSTDYCAITNSYGNKWPKLSELHHKLFGVGFEEAHNAAVDIHATARCFWELKGRGIVIVEPEVPTRELGYTPPNKIGILDDFLIPYRKGDKWGFCDRNKKIVIDCIYQWVDDFVDGFTTVELAVSSQELDSHYGLVDVKGNLVAPCIFDNPIRFSENLACISLNGKYGYIDRAGEVVVPCNYEYAKSFSEGYAEVKLSGKWGYIDKRGINIIPCMYVEVMPFRNGMAIVKSDNGQNLIYRGDGYFQRGRWGVIDKNCIEHAHFIYGKLESFSEDLAAAEKITYFGCDNYPLGCLDEENVDPPGQWGYIDTNGDEVIPFIYDRARSFKEGIAAVCIRRKWGYIDQFGKIVIPIQYDRVCGYQEDILRVRWTTFKNLDEEYVHDSQYRDEAFSNGILRGEYEFIDRTGTSINGCRYECASDFSEGLAAVMIDGHWGYINREGEETIPCIYDHAGDFKDGYAYVGKNYNAGIIDRSGNVIIALQNRYGFEILKNGYFEVYEMDEEYNLLNYHVGYIDKSSTQYWED